MAKQIGEDTKVTLDLKTIGIVVFFIATVIGMWFTLQADIVIAALGIPEFLTEDMVKENVTVIDVGITRVEDASKKNGYRLLGDVAFDEVSKKAAFITPVPGGVGPMTIAMLLKNTLLASKINN